jgi:cupin fold WbuC family metalloprotein
MELRQQSADVYLAPGPIAAIGEKEIEILKSALAKSTRGRVRINAHPSGEDRLHEMFIAIRQDSYIRPHKHPGKSEAFHVVHGAVDIVVFDDDGDIIKIVPLAAGARDTPFYYRMSEPFFHTLIIHSDILVVHEITNGPFRPDAAVFAPFAPVEGEDSAVQRYRLELRSRVAAMAGGK